MGLTLKILGKGKGVGVLLGYKWAGTGNYSESEFGLGSGYCLLWPTYSLSCHPSFLSRHLPKQWESH